MQDYPTTLSFVFLFAHVQSHILSHTLTLTPLIVRAWGETGVNQAEFPVIQTEPKG